MDKDLIKKLRELDEVEMDVIDSVIRQGGRHGLLHLRSGIHKTEAMINSAVVRLKEKGVLAHFKHCGLTFCGPNSLFFEVTEGVI